MASQKTAVITGSTGGLGRVISRLLAKQDWNLVLVNRDREKADSQIESLRRTSPGQEFASYMSNLLDAHDVQETAGRISKQHSAIAALYNVAGLLTDRRIESPQNTEGHFAVNTLAPFLFTNGLLASLANGAEDGSSSVVVNFSSSAAVKVKTLDVERLPNPDSDGGLMGAYAQSKMALTIATAMMADELFEQRILSLAVDPGATKTSMTNSADGMPWFVRLLVPLLFKPPEIQAQRVVQGVQSAVADNKSGLFIVEGRRRPMPNLVSDTDIQSKLRSLLASFEVASS